VLLESALLTLIGLAIGLAIAAVFPSITIIRVLPFRRCRSSISSSASKGRSSEITFVNLMLGPAVIFCSLSLLRSIGLADTQTAHRRSHACGALNHDPPAAFDPAGLAQSLAPSAADVADSVAFVLGVWTIVVLAAYGAGHGTTDRAVDSQPDGAYPDSCAGYRDDPVIDHRLPPPGPSLRAVLVDPQVSAWATRVRVPAVVASERESPGSR